MLSLLPSFFYLNPGEHISECVAFQTKRKEKFIAQKKLETEETKIQWYRKPDYEPVPLEVEGLTKMERKDLLETSRESLIGFDTIKE